MSLRAVVWRVPDTSTNKALPAWVEPTDKAPF